MEWREHTSVGCEDAFGEAQRWIEEVTNKSFGGVNFRSALENGVLLCDLINQLKPGIIKKMNRLSTPIAGLDNINVFLRACAKLGLNEAQLFHPGDLQDVSTRATLRGLESNRRVKNVLITIYWLGRKAQVDPLYSGPQLNLKAFEGLLGIALSRALEDTPRLVGIRDSGYSELWYPERDDDVVRGTQPQPHVPDYRREDSVESIDSAGSFDSLRSHTLSCISDSSFASNTTVRAGSDGCCSDAEAELCLRSADSGQGSEMDAPAPLRRKRQEEDRAKVCPPSPLTRNMEVNPGWIWSKSLSDITPFPSAMHVVRQGSEGGSMLVPGRVHKEPLERRQASVPDSEAKWHNDLTQWKLRRRMSNSDLRRKMHERDNVGLMSNARVVTVGTFRSLLQDSDQEKESLGSRSHNTVTFTKTVSSTTKTVRSSTKAASLSRSHSLICPSTTTVAKEGSLELRHQNRGPLTRGNAVDSQDGPRTSGSLTSSGTVWDQGPTAGALRPSEPPSLGERSHVATLPSDRAGGTATTPTSASPFASQTQCHTRAISSPALMSSTGEGQDNAIPKSLTSMTFLGGSGSCHTHTSSSHSNATASDLGDRPNRTGSHRSASMDSPMDGLEPKQGHLPVIQQQCPHSGEQQQGLAFYRYSSGPTGVSASLPRGYRRADGTSSYLSAGFTPRPFGAKSSRMGSLPRLYKSLQLEDTKLNRDCSLSRPRKQVTITEEVVSAQPWAPVNQSSVKLEMKEGRGQSSILKTRSSVPSSHDAPSGPPSPPASLTLTQTGSSQMRHSDMRVSLSLKPNSRSDFGFVAHWDSTGVRVTSVQPGSPAELCQLCVGDEVVSVGGHMVAEMSYDQWKGAMTSALQKGNLTMDVRRYGNEGQPNSGTTVTMATTVNPSQLDSQAVNGIAAKSMNGGFRDDPMAIRSKEHELIILKNQERRARFFKQKVFPGVSSMVYLCGGSVSAISDLQVPSLSTSSSSWSWDAEDERRRQQNWQKEQERQLQEKYRHDQERLDAEWLQAQKDAGLVGCSQADVGPSKNISGNWVTQVSSTEMNNGIASHDGHQQTQSQPTPPVQGASNQKEVVCDWRRENPGVEEVEPQPQEAEIGDFWSGDSYGFTELSAADRLKSKSTSSLVGFHNEKMKGGSIEVPRRKLGQCMSPAEAERQQILEEMRKRTALLTDSSWIRQRAASNKEPINRSRSLRRYESMENLHSTSTSTSNPQRPHSSLGFSASQRPQLSRHSMAGALGLFSNGTQKHSPTWCRPSSTSPTLPNLGEEPSAAESRLDSQQRNRVLSSRQVCSVCECPLGRGAAMVIKALGLCFHLACFQCVDCRCHLGGYELRTQVRIRNRKPYCDHCYIRRKSHSATPL
ncbi:hypothetical protein UPYG_G00016310 [Umbra pygmaea]|uniref:LIM domain only protein 7-like n=1 Tax=Umbra pygmaea TaxID=75934 RepID=A0ABD0Y3V3_UMBPY